MLNARIIIFSLNMGLSFAILVLYIAFVESIILVVLLLTASVVAASRDDLTLLRASKTYLMIMIAFAVLVFFTVAYFSAPFSQFLFYALIALNFGLLLAYLVSKFSSSQRERRLLR